MITIGVPVRNGIKHVSKLLYSLKKNTQDVSVNKTIIVDDGSSPKIIRSGLKLENINVIRNEKSKGFPAACNQIIDAAKGSKYICILNSDTFVAPRWLFHLYNAMEKDPKIGICGPSTSYANDPQCRRDICGMRYQMFEPSINKYAEKLERIYTESKDIGSALTGFCMLIRASVLEEIGVFDEQFGLGSFEEADLCKRIMLAEYKCAWIPYSYVHHYGKGTFGEENIDWKKLWAENQKKFEEKWKNN